MPNMLAPALALVKCLGRLVHLTLQNVLELELLAHGTAQRSRAFILQIECPNFANYIAKTRTTRNQLWPIPRNKK